MSETTLFLNPRVRGEPPTSEWRSQIQAIRVPVKPANRERLRQLRSQEMVHWEQHQPADGPHSIPTRAAATPPRQGGDTEARLILGILAATLVVAVLRQTPLGGGLQEATRQLWMVVQSWLG